MYQENNLDFSPQYYDTNNNLLTGNNILFAKNGMLDYQIDGNWFAGTEIRGKRSSQEDRMIAAALSPEEEAIYQRLNKQNKEALLKTITQELVEAIKINDDYQWSGSTGIIAILEPHSLTSFITNLGDSQVFAVKVNQRNQLIACERLNTLHNPSEPNENKRLTSAEMPVIEGRLKGGLAVSRAFGDADCERYGLSTEPALHWAQHNLNESEELFFVVACDGLTENNVFTTQSLGEYIAKNRSQTLKDLVNGMARTAYDQGSEDNISVQVVKLTRNTQGTTKILGVFDGHGSGMVSQYLKDNWIEIFRQCLNVYKARLAQTVPPQQTITFNALIAPLLETAQRFIPSFIHHQKISEKPISEKPTVKYLLLDHRVLILCNDEEIITLLKRLTQDGEYQIVLHSAHLEKNQMGLLMHLQISCAEKDLVLPPVYAIVVYDRHQYPTVSSYQPIIEEKNGYKMIYWGSDQSEGKASLRRALETALAIQPDDRQYHTVFDDGEKNVEVAKEEGYQTVLVQGDKNRLEDGLKACLSKCQNATSPATMSASEPLYRYSP